MFGNIESSIEWTRMFIARSKCFCFHNKPLNYSVLLPPAAKANGLPWNFSTKFFHMHFLFFALSVIFGQAGTKHIIYLGRNISIMSCQKLFIYHFLVQWYPYKSCDEFWCVTKFIRKKCCDNLFRSWAWRTLNNLFRMWSGQDSGVNAIHDKQTDLRRKTVSRKFSTTTTFLVMDFRH